MRLWRVATCRGGRRSADGADSGAVHVELIKDMLVGGFQVPALLGLASAVVFCVLFVLPPSGCWLIPLSYALHQAFRPMARTNWPATGARLSKSMVEKSSFANIFFSLWLKRLSLSLSKLLCFLCRACDHPNP